MPPLSIFVRGQQPWEFVVVSIGPLGEVDAPRESHSRQHAPRCPTFASDSLQDLWIRIVFYHAPRRAIRDYICWAREWLRWLRDRIWPRIDLSLRGFKPSPVLVGSESAEVFWALSFRGLCGPLTKATSPRLEITTSSLRTEESIAEPLALRRVALLLGGCWFVTASILQSCPRNAKELFHVNCSSPSHSYRSHSSRVAIVENAAQ